MWDTPSGNGHTLTPSLARLMGTHLVSAFLLYFHFFIRSSLLFSSSSPSNSLGAKPWVWMLYFQVNVEESHDWWMCKG